MAFCSAIGFGCSAGHNGISGAGDSASNEAALAAVHASLGSKTFSDERALHAVVPRKATLAKHGFPLRIKGRNLASAADPGTDQVESTDDTGSSVSVLDPAPPADLPDWLVQKDLARSSILQGRRAIDRNPLAFQPRTKIARDKTRAIKGEPLPKSASINATPANDSTNTFWHFVSEPLDSGYYYDLDGYFSYKMGTLYRDHNASSIEVYFNSIDISQFGEVDIYDDRGNLCDWYGNSTYGYYQPNAFVSNNCGKSSYVTVWLTDGVTCFQYNDGTNSCDSLDNYYYNGVSIAGIEESQTNDAPVAVASASTYTGKINTSIAFDGSASYDPDQSASDLKYTWDFGDGTGSHDVSPIHAYNRASTTPYLVKLTVDDGRGGRSTDHFSVTITPYPPLLNVVLRAATLSDSNPAYLLIGAEGATTAPSRVVVSWGDGSTTNREPYPLGTNVGFSHSYSVPGTYAIVITGKNTGGLTTVLKTVNVVVDQVPPTLTLVNKAALDLIQGKAKKLSAQLKLNDDGHLVGLGVDWGDPAQKGNSAFVNSTALAADRRYGASYTLTKAFTYKMAGTYLATFTATDNGGNANALQYSYQTNNVAPTISVPHLTATCSAKTHTCAVKFGNPNLPLSPSFANDSDGTVVSETLGVVGPDKATPVTGCEDAAVRTLNCAVTRGGSYYIRARVTDNFGATTQALRHFIGK